MLPASPVRRSRPLVPVAISSLIATPEVVPPRSARSHLSAVERADAEELSERQTYGEERAADKRRKLRSARFGDPVVVVPIDF